MRGAPPLVDSLLNELWYTATLLAQGDRAAAVHHAREAREKAERVRDLVKTIQHAEMRSLCAALRLQSAALRRNVRELVQHSKVLISRSNAAHERFAMISSLKC